MLEKILGKDPDEVFSYQTEKVLIIRDLLLAIIGLIFSAGVLIYTILYVFLVLERYNEKGIWTGYMFYRLTGKGYSDDNGLMKVWDHGDLLYPEQDSKGIMLGFAVQEVNSQEIGYCLVPCDIDDDCPNIPPKCYGHCTSNGYCDAPTWCPNIDANGTVITYYYVKGVENFFLELWTGIYFPQFSDHEYISYKGNKHEIYPKDKATLFRIGDILYEAGIEKIEDIYETGAIIDISFYWKCDTTLSDCIPEIHFSRDDSEELPIIYNRIYHYTEDELVKRDYKRFTAIKFLLRSYGQGFQFSLFLTVLQVSAGLALLKMGQVLSDFIMLYLYPNREKREGFAMFKTEDSVDFSDKAYKIDYINFLRENQDKEQKEDS
ncbi:hypothetical protein SteCoe_3068 [Stentor coeruleus]|uniref:P2X purinoceptor n=1 Tax=Stentor coeruleus TaxID=5963 RepID=A0A1R2CXZ1_9CILI|nr:hypothetical protein SteCoe_3068 [Stentor coeruleus]